MTTAGRYWRLFRVQVRSSVLLGLQYRADFVLDGAESSLRLAYSGVTPAVIEEGVKRLAEAYRQLSGVAGDHAA